MDQQDKKLTRRAVLGAGVSMPLGILAAPVEVEGDDAPQLEFDLVVSKA
jgi:hypothetical protein